MTVDEAETKGVMELAQIDETANKGRWYKRSQDIWLCLCSSIFILLCHALYLVPFFVKLFYSPLLVYRKYFIFNNLNKVCLDFVFQNNFKYREKLWA